MWIMFLLGACVAGVIALIFGVVLHKIWIWMEREERNLELENEVREKIKKEIEERKVE